MKLHQRPSLPSLPPPPTHTPNCLLPFFTIQFFIAIELGFILITIVLQCKTVINKLQRRVDHEGHQIIPMLTELWKRIEHSGDNLLDLRKIFLRVDKFEYSGVVDLVSDVQLMLKSSMQYFGFSYEVC